MFKGKKPEVTIQNCQFDMSLEVPENVVEAAIELAKAIQATANILHYKNSDIAAIKLNTNETPKI